MSQYTLEVRQIDENGVDIFEGWTYPIFDEAYRAVLNQKILEHFYFREIGVETVGRFIFNVRVRMNEIMPTINKLYTSEALPQRILDNYDVTEIYSRDTTNVGTAGAKKLFSDTPNGRLNLTEVDNGKWIREINDDTANNSDTGTENWTRTMSGNIGIQTDADSIIKYRASLLNCDQVVFDGLSDLFMLVY
jgi:hypothetical protein